MAMNKEILMKFIKESKWLRWVIILLIARIPKPFILSGFLGLNPTIKSLLLNNKELISKHIGNDSTTVERRLGKISNLISCIFLYFATSTSRLIPQDYAAIFLLIKYHGELNPPSCLNIHISPKYSKYLKIETYKQYPTLTKLYENKEFIIFPAIFAQILSNYLTPTRFKLNKRYLSSSIKKYILNPIWLNFSLGINYSRLNWVKLIRTYALQNFILMGVVGVYTFKTRVLDKLYEIKYEVATESEIAIIKNYLMFIINKANSIMNFIYLPNMLSILLIVLTSPIFRVLTPTTNAPRTKLQQLYLDNYKLFFKTYTKIIGFIAGFITLYLNSINIIPAIGYDREPNEPSESRNIRYIDKTFLNELNLYLFRLILLAKWRIVKMNHPKFKLVKLRTWRKAETVLMCWGMFKIMNLHDYLKRHKESDTESYARLKNESTLRVVDYIM